MKQTEKEKAISLLKERDRLSKENRQLEATLSRKCEHGIKKAYYFISPLICFDCAVKYYKYCKNNNLTIDESLYHDVARYIDVEAKKKQQVKKQMEQYRRYEKALKRKKDRENRLENYKNKKYLTPEEAGLRYERYIGYLLEMQGYNVVYNGATKGKKDRGIDIIATYKDSTYLIQCKRYSEKHQVHENTLTQLIGTGSSFSRRHPEYKNIKYILYTTNNNLDKEAQETLSLFLEIQHIIKPYDENYPMIKCNINSMKEKIYHLPNDAKYDMIKININTGECYCNTIEDAEKKGFRRAKL